MSRRIIAIAVVPTVPEWIDGFSTRLLEFWIEHSYWELLAIASCYEGQLTMLGAFKMPLEGLRETAGCRFDVPEFTGKIRDT